MVTFYSELLRNPFWQKKRLEIFERDEWTCQKCGDTFNNLQVHHLGYMYDTMPWEYPNSMLVTYCELCHEKVEFMKKVVREAPEALKKQGFESGDIREIMELVTRRLMHNHHSESARDYMRLVKPLLYG